MQGGDLWTGSEYGVAGAAIAHGAYYSQLRPSDINPFHHLAQLRGYVDNPPNTVIGLALGSAGNLFDWNGEQIKFGWN